MHDLGAERSVIGSLILMDQPDVAVGMLREEFFWSPQHRLIFQAIKSVVDDFGSPDFQALESRMNQMGTLRDAGGMDYLVTCGESVPSWKNFRFYAKTVMDWHECRVLFDRATALGRAAKSGDCAGSRGLAIGLLDGLGAEGRSSFSLEDSLMEAESKVADGVMTGFSVWDDASDEFEGANKAGAHVIAASSGKGKTLLLAQIALHVAKGGGRVVFGTFELSHRIITRRLLRMLSGYSSIGWAEKFVQSDPYGPNRFREAESALLSMDFTYYDAGTDVSKPKTIEPFLDFVRFKHEQKPVDAVFLDYLQVAQLSRRTSSDFERIETVARMYAGLAQNLGFAGFAAAQSKVDAGTKETYLRGAKGIEDSADSVVFKQLVRPKNEPEFWVLSAAKQRYGKALDVMVELDGKSLLHREVGGVV